MKAWIVGLSASTLVLFLLCGYLLFSVVDLAIALDDSRKYGKGLEDEIGYMVSVVERTAVGMPKEKLDALVRELGGGQSASSPTGNELVIGTLEFRVEGGYVRSVRRLP